ncbi:hypothetical protein Z965_04275 [Clostridium novyi A str. BKT29909]|nr:hypothetical protein Z965_04275 [Clostridium novyi A str. BKT29909]KEH92734.1 hypothetical protein Z963_04915 [Clostridium botulinum C/D str. It1]
MYKMLQKVGIESIIVKSRPMQHVWNMVYIDGNWYYVDATWDDPVPYVLGGINYHYYNLSDYEMELGENGEAHIWDKTKYPRAEISYDWYLEEKLEDKKENASTTKIDVSTANALLLNIKLNKMFQ